MIKGLFETHINVSSLERSMKFYGETLGLQLGTYEKERKAAFYWVGEWGEAMLGLWEKPADQIIPQHFAFRCSVNDLLQKATEYLQEKNLDFYNFLQDSSKQPMVFGWMPAISIYFKDPDNHELEFIAMLQGKPRPELGILSYEKWKELTMTDQTG